MKLFKFWKSFFFDQFFLHFGSGDSGGPSTTTVNQSNVPDWLRPQVENVLMGAGRNLFTTEKIDTGEKDPITGKPIYEESITGTKPFTPYSTRMEDYVAGFSPLQQQVQANAANLQVPGQFGQATGFANAAGQGGMESAQRAYGYGNAGFQSGQQGQQIGIQGGQYYGGQGAGYGQQAANLAAPAMLYGAQGAGYGDLASQIGQMGLQAQQTGQGITQQSQDYARQQADMGALYGRMATDPGVYQQYMSPYQQAVTDLQIQGAQRQADIARAQRSSQAARAGAFGGARQAIENAEADRALQSQLQNIQAQGLQSAYQQAQGNILNRAQLGLSGLGGAQSGLGTALQGGQLGLSGIGTALQGMQTGIQGTQAGLQGVGAANQAYQTGIQGAQTGLQGVDRALAGTGQGMQGAQVGLQGVSGAQAGYGLANQAAQNLASIGTQQLAAQTGILGLQNQIGQQQQAQEQAKINQAISNYANAQNAPMDAFNQYNALLRGYAVPGTTTTQYQAAPNLLSQVAGAGTAGIAGLGLYNAATGGSGAGSDIRIKENIERIGTLDNGLGLYEFEYKLEFKDHPQCGHGRFRGVMAQEVEALMPEAVTTMDNGFKAVKYDLIGAV